MAPQATEGVRPSGRQGEYRRGRGGGRALYSRLEEVLGVSEADFLMNHLSREPGDEVATKVDLARLEDRFDRLEDRIEARFDRMEDRMDRMQRFYVGTTVGSMTALTAIFSLVVAFFG